MTKVQLIEVASNNQIKITKSGTKEEIKKEIIEGLKRNLDQLQKFVTHCKRYENSFFWNNLGNAFCRRNQEARAKFKRNNIVIDKHIISFESSAIVSCKNFYFTKNIWIDDNKKTMATIKQAIKNITKIIENLIIKEEPK